MANRKIGRESPKLAAAKAPDGMRLFCRTARDSSRGRGTWPEHRRLSLN
jgi:hypothetical protein